MILKDIRDEKTVQKFVKNKITFCHKSTHMFGAFDGEELVGVCVAGNFFAPQVRYKYKNFIGISVVADANAGDFLIDNVLEFFKRDGSIDGLISFVDYGNSVCSRFKLIGKTNSSYSFEKNGVEYSRADIWDLARKELTTDIAYAKDNGFEKVGKDSKWIFAHLFRGDYSQFEKTVGNKVVAGIWHRKKFFETWNAESAWVYGLVLGDGHVHLDYGNGTIMFCAEEATIIKFNNLLKIKTKPSFKRGIWHTYINDMDLAIWFRDRGTGTKKALQMAWPHDIEKTEYISDFIRGLIEADGYFGFEKPYGRDKVRLGFSSANKSFIKDFERCMSKKIGILTNINQYTKDLNKKTFEHFYVKYSEQNSLKILSWIYDKSIPSMRDDARYEKYLFAKKSFEDSAAKVCKICGEAALTDDLCKSHMLKNRVKKRREKFKCKIEGCESPYHGGGYCMKHMWAAKKEKELFRGLEFGKKIVSLRQKFGLSQTALGEKLGLCQDAISKIEIGNRGMKDAEMDKLCKKFDLKKEDIF